MTNYRDDLIEKIDEIFGFNLNNKQDSVDYDFGQYKLNQLYKPLVKHFVNEFSKFLNGQDASDSNQIISLFVDFFKLYYFQGDFGYFKSKYSSFNYKVPYGMNYTGADTEFWRASKDCYYVKTSDVVNDMDIRVPDPETLGDKSIHLQFFKRTKLDEEGNFTPLDVIIESVVDEENGELLGYDINIINFDDGTTSKTAREKFVLDKMQDFGIQTTPGIKNTLSEFLSKRGRDYFIHKNLKGFLRGELERYLFQVMKGDTQGRIDILSVENKIEEIKKKYEGDNEYIEYQIAKIYAENTKDINPTIYQNAYAWIYNFINILGDFEEFKAKLWNKKRKIIKQEYCISLGKIDEYETLNPAKNEMFGEIMNNEEQLKIWENELKTEKYLNKISMNTIKSELSSGIINLTRNLVVDTNYFKKDSRLYETLSSRGDKKLYEDGEKLDGIMIKSENYQGLRILTDDYREKIQGTYIDPPFNLEVNGDFIYKTDYKDGSRASLLNDRYNEALLLMSDDSSIYTRCDYHGINIVNNVMDENFGAENYKSEIIIPRKRESMGTSNKLEEETERLFMYTKNKKSVFNEVYRDREESSFKWTGFLKQGIRNPRERKFFGYTFTPADGQHFSLIQEKCDRLIKEHYLRLRAKSTGAVFYYDEEKRLDKYKDVLLNTKVDKFKYKDIENKDVYGITSLDDLNIPFDIDDLTIQYLPSSTIKVGNVWLDITGYSSTTGFSTENSEQLLKRCIEIISNKNEIFLDYFAGSATTQAAAQKLGRKWIGIELGGQFEEFDLPRLKSVLEGKQSGISTDKDVDYKGGGFFTYLYLNQYEDRFSVDGYLTKLEDEIVELRDLNIDENTQISQILSPLNELKEHIYNIDDELSNDELQAMSRMIHE